MEITNQTTMNQEVRKITRTGQAYTEKNLSTATYYFYWATKDMEYGVRNVCKPKNTRKRVLETEINYMERTWKELQGAANERMAWHELVEGLGPDDR